MIVEGDKVVVAFGYKPDGDEDILTGTVLQKPNNDGRGEWLIATQTGEAILGQFQLICKKY